MPVIIIQYRYLSFVLLILMLGATGCSTPTVTDKPVSVEITQPQTVEPPVPARGPVSIAAVGDIMLGTDYPRDRLPPEEGRALLAEVSGVLSAADIAIGNLEGVMMDGGEPVKRCHNPAQCYLFRTPTHYAERLHEAGIDAVSLANNHALDFGLPGREATIRALDQVGIQYAGPIERFATWEVRGVSVALIAFAPNREVYSLLDIGAARRVVSDLAGQYDIVLVSFHGGAEGLDAQRLSFTTERFHGEDRGDVTAFAHAVVDAGADLVIGHGPHVLRAVEVYRGRLIAYSLGNFCTYNGISVQGVKGLAPILDVTLDETGRLLAGQIVSTRQQRPRGPVFDHEEGAAKMIRRLTALDFPQAAWFIEENGRLIETGPPPPPWMELDAHGRQRGRALGLIRER